MKWERDRSAGFLQVRVCSLVAATGLVAWRTSSTSLVVVAERHGGNLIALRRHQASRLMDWLLFCWCETPGLSPSSVVNLSLILVATAVSNRVVIGVAQASIGSHAHLLSFPIPSRVKLSALVFANVPVQVVLLSLVSHPLFDHFAALTIKHSLMRHLLHSSLLIAIHLLTLGNLLSLSISSTSSFSLVGLGHRLPIGSHRRGAAVSHRLEATTRRTTILGQVAETLLHVPHATLHATEHLVDITETTEATHHTRAGEEGVVLERIVKAKPAHHLLRHLVHLLVLALHHLHHIACAVGLQFVAALVAVIGLG